MCEAVHSMKKIVAGLSYPMPLCFLVKAALAYIAAGSCNSCGVHLIIFIRLLMLQGCTITPHNTPECHAAPSQQTANSRGVE